MNVKNKKLIFVSGGVISGVGKGTITASIAKCLQQRSLKVAVVKIDPYINIDAGTMRPTEHGEVWVTHDGGEIDQDLGNYERFLDINISKRNNITTGQIYLSLIEKERAGKFLGKTVQPIPHLIEEIKNRINEATRGSDVALVEIGGTVGDYENFPYLFAAKSFEIEYGKENVVHILVSYLPMPKHLGEAKTKPTQQAIRALNEIAIVPDFIICRAEQEIDDSRKEKIERYANIPSEHVISAPDLDIVYEIPLKLEKEGFIDKLLKRLSLHSRKPDWSEWKKRINSLKNPRRIFKVALVGKYIASGHFSLADSYISINEALKHAAAFLNSNVEIGWIDANKLNEKQLALFDAIIVPGGFGSTGVEGKINAIKFARETNKPFLGLCYGMQLAVVEFARNVCNLEEAHTTEVNPKTKHPVIDILPEQREILKEGKLGASMRLGEYAAVVEKDSKVYEVYKRFGRIRRDTMKLKTLEEFRKGIIPRGSNVIIERHRHRYEVNPKYHKILQQHGLKFSGLHLRSDGIKLVEFIELPNHRFFVATQAHPEFTSRFLRPAPLFVALLEACL
ncbi:MAG: CTP synthase [Candidatus Diapherotrites archaeon]|nr:CTP synthase [Candidatus Diapherotrites archaeon]